MKKGIFWVITDAENIELITVTALCDEAGNLLENAARSSKSGLNFNHEAEWQRLERTITNGKPFNYYPRGRVEMRNGKAMIFLNPDINTEPVINLVKETFQLSGLERIDIKSDGSNHYKYMKKTET